MADLGPLAEEYVRAALAAAEADVPPFPVDSWSDPAVPGQWVVIEDDEGRRSQARIDHTIVRGATVGPGRLRAPCAALVRSVVAAIRTYLGAGSGVVVSRPYPEPATEGMHVAHLEFRGIWLRLIVGYDGEGTVAILAAQMGRGAVPLAEPEGEVIWL